MILLRNGDLRNIPLVNKLFPYIYEKKITFYDICLLRWDTYESRKSSLGDLKSIDNAIFWKTLY